MGDRIGGSCDVPGGAVLAYLGLQGRMESGRLPPSFEPKNILQGFHLSIRNTRGQNLNDPNLSRRFILNRYKIQVQRDTPRSKNAGAKQPIRGSLAREEI
ncbi:MAG: hypothetical protein NVS2B16_05350 [Chloroflexota bacterium]